MSGHTSSTNISPTMPPEKIKGSSARTIIRVDAMTASRTSAMPSMVACFGDLPILRCRSTAWISMIESSTSLPMLRSRPMRVPLLNVMPNGTISRTAMASEVGNVTMAIRVPRHSPRKRTSAIAVKTMATASSCQTFSNKMSTKWALSYEVSNLRPGFSDSSCLTTCMTAGTTWAELAPGF